MLGLTLDTTAAAVLTGLTTWDVGADLLAVKLPLPWYAAVIEWVPLTSVLVLKMATPEPLRGGGADDGRAIEEVHRPHRYSDIGIDRCDERHRLGIRAGVEARVQRRGGTGRVDDLRHSRRGAGGKVRITRVSCRDRVGADRQPRWC